MFFNYDINLHENTRSNSRRNIILYDRSQTPKRLIRLIKLNNADHVSEVRLRVGEPAVYRKSWADLMSHLSTCNLCG